MITKHPKSLKPHPLLAKLPAPDRDDPTWGSFSDNLNAAGPDVIPPLIITDGKWVVDGRKRLMAAQDWQWAEIPCVEIPEDQAAAVIVESLVGQRSITRGAKLYLVLEHMTEYLKAADARRLANLKKGRKTSEKPLFLPKGSNFPSEDAKVQLLELLGVSDETWKLAVKVRKLFTERPEIKAEYEPQLLDGRKNLWNVISGVAGADPTKDKPRPVNSVNQLELFDSALEPMVQAVKPWAKIKQAEREMIETHWRQAALKMPAQACETLGNIFLEVAKEKSAA